MIAPGVNESSPDGITVRERINISRTSTGNFSYDTTVEVVRTATTREVFAASESVTDGPLFDDYRRRRLAALAHTAQAEIAERKAREAVQ
jgi:hypothetical protein